MDESEFKAWKSGIRDLTTAQCRVLTFCLGMASSMRRLLDDSLTDKMLTEWLADIGTLSTALIGTETDKSTIDTSVADGVFLHWLKGLAGLSGIQLHLATSFLTISIEAVASTTADAGFTWWLTEARKLPNGQRYPVANMWIDEWLKGTGRRRGRGVRQTPRKNAPSTRASRSGIGAEESDTLTVKNSEHLKSNGVRVLYHFTRKSNLPLVEEHGLCSKQDLESIGLWPGDVSPNGDPESHDSDKEMGNWDKISLSLVRRTPMVEKRLKQGQVDLYWVEVDLCVADREGVTFANTNATYSGRRWRTPRHINFECLHKERVQYWDWFRHSQAEVLVPGRISCEHLTNTGAVTWRTL